MRQLTPLLALLLCACASPPPPAPAAKVVDPTVYADFRIVPRAPDIATYPVVPEHVWVPAPSDRVWITVKVGNHSLPRITPPLMTPPVQPPAVQANQPAPMPSPAYFRTSVRFGFDRHALDSAAKLELDRFLGSLGRNLSDSDIVVEGHTDSVGDAHYNLRLSQRRAKAVKDYLLTKGASAARVASTGSGESEPVASNESESGRATNRRASVRASQE